MRILATQYTLSMKSLDVYIAGCRPPHCEGCHNPEGWDFNQGTFWDNTCKDSLITKLSDFSDLIDKVMIFGGEPLDSDHFELMDLLLFIDSFKLPIWLFTRYSIDDVPVDIKAVCSYIKCGRYIESKKTDDNIQYGMNLATSNQKIYDLTTMK